MSAPNQGRQSPEPGHQTKEQVDAPAKPNDQGAGAGEKAGEESQNTLSNLGSNPGGPLDKEAEKKTSKTT